MKVHLISGGCGFVGRNMAKRIYTRTEDVILVIDDLSIGLDPSKWFFEELSHKIKDLKVYGKAGRLLFLNQDFRIVLRKLLQNQNYFQDEYGLKFKKFADVFHFAAIVGGRATIVRRPIKSSFRSQH